MIDARQMFNDLILRDERFADFDGLKVRDQLAKFLRSKPTVGQPAHPLSNVALENLAGEWVKWNGQRWIVREGMERDFKVWCLRIAKTAVMDPDLFHQSAVADRIDGRKAAQVGLSVESFRRAGHR